jgi:MFS family permease
MIGYRALEFGAGPVALGTVAASFSASSVLAALPAGRLADRTGGLRIVATGIAVLLVGIAAAVTTNGIGWLIGASVVVGLGQLLVAVGQQSFVAERADRHSADGAFGALTSALSIGQVVGPLVATWVATRGWVGSGPTPDTTLGLLSAGALVAFSIPFCWILSRAGRPDRPAQQADAPKASARTIIRTPGMWQALLVSGVVLASMDMLYAFLPAWAADHNVAATTVGWLLALRAGVTVVSRVGLGRMVAKFGRRPLLLTALAMAAVAFSVLPLVSVVGAFAVMVALGVGLGLPQPMTMAWVVARSNPRFRGAALGLRLTSNRLTQIVMPITVGVIAAPLGVAGIFWASAGLLSGAVAVVASSASILGPTAGPPAEPEPEPG